MINILKWANLVASVVILVLGIITVIQFFQTGFRPKNEENTRRFRVLLIRFIILAALSVVLRLAVYLIRMNYMYG